MSTPGSQETAGSSETEHAATFHEPALVQERETSAQGSSDAPPASESASTVELENPSEGLPTSLPDPVPQEKVDLVESGNHTREAQEPRGTRVSRPGAEPEVQRVESFKSVGSADNPVYDGPRADKVPSVGRLDVKKSDLATNARIADDGRVNINIGHTSQLLSQLLHKTRSQRPETTPNPSLSPELPPPRLNLVIQVVGSRGDVQPFVALGKVLKEQYHHRVRLATHATFKDFVESNGLEFFNIGGDPAQLMAFMVKNPGLMPGVESLRHGDVGKRQQEIWEILLGCWRSCIETGDGMDEESGEEDPRPFVADAIIANPPSFAHLHCAEKLGIPVHLMFTMPWSPTEVFPHPLANIQSSSTDPNLTNLLSYTLVEALTWQGLGHVINRFRTKNLRLEAVSLIYAPTLIDHLHIPYTYCWSPALIPKPYDWGQHISISGFYFLNLASAFTPDPELLAFLNYGPPPVYIGFGSIVVDDPDAMTKMIFDAIKKAGVRALVSKGWGGLGKNDLDLPDTVYMLGNIPHDWLFQRVSCVVHHGGAGTTAAGISLGKPTVVVPFFGDQPFWGAMIARAGAGPIPVPYKKLTADILATSIKEALEPSVKDQAAKLAASISQETGTVEGAASFHRQLDIDHMRCSLGPSRVAVWRVRRTNVRLSALAMTVLLNEGLLKLGDLKLYRAKEHDTRSEPISPLAGLVTEVLGAMGDLIVDVTSLPVASVKSVKNVAEHPPSSPFASRQNTKHLFAPSRNLSTSSTLLPATSENRSGTSTPRPDLATEPKPRSLDPGDEVLRKEDTTDQASLATQVMETPVVDAAPNSLPSLVSSSSTHTLSDAATMTQPRTHAPLGTESKEVGPGEIVTRFVGGVLRSPLDMTLTLARGFNNAPKLYGDTTVRKPDKIDNLQNGLKMAGKGLGYGFYDGISGIVTQPVNGAKNEGVLGFVKGVGKGLGGVVLKPTAAILGVPGYTYKGLYKELRKSRGKPIEEFLITGRIAEGVEDFEASTEQECEKIVTRWREVEPGLRKSSSHEKKSSFHDKKFSSHDKKSTETVASGSTS